jgi:ubiquinone/menaquinone biosynthesis C-methylase UbiE
MTDVGNFWEQWSPYLSYFEDSFLDIESIRQLKAFVTDPVLVIGGGQGLLVGELKKNGFQADGVDSEPRMIEFAEKRRGIKLIQADGANLPFADNHYNTCIVATGVIDFLDDKNQIKAVAMEALRVTDDAGKVLVAFYRVHPKVEALMRYIGTMTEANRWLYRRMINMLKLKPWDFFMAVKNDPTVSTLGALVTLIRTQMFLPRKEKKTAENWKKAWEKACQDLDDPEALIRGAPESLPYRDKEQIHELFKDLTIPVQQTHVLESCIVVRIG